MTRNPKDRGRRTEDGSRKSEAEILAWLRSVPEATVSHDLTPEILAKVRLLEPASRTSHVSRFTSHLFIPLAAAAAVILLLGGVWLAAWPPADPSGKAAKWLCETQEPDGSWSAAKWGGDRHFEVALTGLSLMTLIDESSGWTPTSGRRQWQSWFPGFSDRARRARSTQAAIAYLIKMQRDDGRFGEPFSGTPYNQGIATLALAKAYESRKDESLRLAVDKAVAAIGAAQYKDGGWGYSNEAHPQSNLAVTLWQIEALRAAAQRGWDVRPRIERGLRWMAGMATDDGSFGYQRSGDIATGASPTLTAMGAMSLLDPAHIGLVSPGRHAAIKAQVQKLASTPGPDMDYYRRYFLAAALKKMDEKPARAGLTAIRQDTRNRQVRCGAEAGSWTADDRWGSSGGRLYATAMASLSLH